MSKKEFIDIHNLEVTETNYENLQILEQSLKEGNRILAVQETNKVTLSYVVESTYKVTNDYLRIGKMRNGFFVKNGAINIPKTEMENFFSMISEAKNNITSEEV